MGVGLLCKKMHSVHILGTAGIKSLKKLTVFEILTINGFNGLAVFEETGWGWSPCDDGNPFLEYSLVARKRNFGNRTIFQVFMAV